MAQPVLAGEVPDRPEGHVRYYHFGEGEYAETEQAIRTLLGDGAPAASGLADESPHGLVTPESYLGYERLARNGGDRVRRGRGAGRTRSRRGSRDNELAFGGRWRVEDERAVAGRDARLRLDYRARDVFLVLTGRARCACSSTASPSGSSASAATASTQLVERPKLGDHLLELRFTPGVAAYAFTFG